MSKLDFWDTEAAAIRNDFMVLTPISQEEKDHAESTPYGAEHIVALYQLPDSDEIQIGLLSPLQNRFFSADANIENLKYATTVAYFHDGYTELGDMNGARVDRPVYLVYTTRKNTVKGARVLNANDENGLRIPLKDIVNGKVTIESSEPVVKKR